MKTNKLYIIAALTGTVLAACQQMEIEPQLTEEEPATETVQTMTLTVEATKGEATKALSLEGTTLTPYWVAGEKVAVYKAGTKIGTLTATPGSPNTSATLSGTVTTAGLSEGETINLIFPGRDDGKWTYLGQDGSAPSEDGNLASLFDYAKADVEISTIDTEAGKITIDGTAAFKNQQSVFRFGFKVGGAGDPVKVKSFTVSAEQDQLATAVSFSDFSSTHGAVSVESAATVDGNLYYLSLRNDNTATADVLSFSVIRDSDSALLEGTKNIPVAALGNGKYLTANVSVTQKALAPAAAGAISEELEVL